MVRELQKWYEQLSDNGQVKIRVNHYPIQANMTQADWDGLGYLDYDLSIAGHYHGTASTAIFWSIIYSVTNFWNSKRIFSKTE